MSAAVASTLTKNFSESLRTKLPNSQQSKAKRALQEIWTAETKKDALTAFDALEPHRICERKERDGLTVRSASGNLISEMACHARPTDL
jgi:hypothetical protein